MTVSDMTKTLYSLLLMFTLTSKKFINFISQKFMSMSMTFIAKNNEEITMKDFISKYFLEVKAISIRTKLNLND